MNPIARMMKRYIKMPLKYALPLLFVCALVLVATTGCTTKDTTQNLSSGNGSSGEAGVGVKINSMQNYSQLGSGYSVSTPKAGYKYVVFDVSVTNLNKKDYSMGSPYYFKMSTKDGTAYSYSSASYYTNHEIDSVSHTSPGEKVTGQVAFEVPENAIPAKLVYNDYSNQVTTNL